MIRILFLTLLLLLGPLIEACLPVFWTSLSSGFVGFPLLNASSRTSRAPLGVLVTGSPVWVVGIVWLKDPFDCFGAFEVKKSAVLIGAGFVLERVATDIRM